MARLAIFIDGAYIDPVARNNFGLQVHFGAFAEEITKIVGAQTPEPVDLLRTYYYNCPPFQGNPPTEEDKRRYDGYRKFSEALKSLPRFQLREGRLAFRGNDAQGHPIFQQKRVDLLMGIDLALLSGKGRISHVALVAGDSDFLPAVEAAKQEGVSAWLIHGPVSTYHRDLWLAADERFELNTDFMRRCARNS